MKKMSSIVKIALPLPVEKSFSYRIEVDNPEEFIGFRALVPFGNRTMTGYILGKGKEEDFKKIKNVIEILDQTPVFSENMLKLIHWIADYYICPVGLVLESALPQGLNPRSVVKITVNSDVETEDIEEMEKRSPKRASILKYLMKVSGSITPGKIEKDLNFENISPQLNALESLGFIHIDRFLRKSTKAKTQQAARIPDEIISDEEKLKEIFDKLDSNAPAQAAFFSHIYLNQSSGHESLVSQAVDESNSNRNAVAALAGKSFVEIYEKEIDRSNPKNIFASDFDDLQAKPNENQEKAIGQIKSLIEENSRKPILLHGDPRSGKTYVLLKTIENIIESGQQALVLIPEIALTPEHLERYEKAFPGQTVIYHSGMSEGARYDAWNRIRLQEARLVIGTRSALFAPLDNLGLIAVEDEHDHSYKQESAPMLNARDCSIVRSGFEQCPVLLLSSAPSMETYYNSIRGKYSRIRLEGRADGLLDPEIELIDAKNARKENTTVGRFTTELIGRIRQTLNENRKVIIFRNRRGFSTYLECPDCNHVPQCINCDLTLTFHKSSNLLRCHYCGYSETPSKSCPSCGHPEMKLLGAGTQRLEEEIEDILGDDHPVCRLDTDSIAGRGNFARILNDFISGNCNVLIGTQMVAKGVGFSDVGIVVVAGADQLLFIPDFRASERAYQLLTQLSGRAGRTEEEKAQLLLQTMNPDHQAIDNFIHSRQKEFYETELSERRHLFYPPFSRFIQIELSSKNENKLTVASIAFSKLLPRNNRYFKVLGPTIPEISRLKGYFRKKIIIKSYKNLAGAGKITNQSIRKALEIYKREHSSKAVKIKIDVDAYSTL